MRRGPGAGRAGGRAAGHGRARHRGGDRGRLPGPGPGPRAGHHPGGRHRARGGLGGARRGPPGRGLGRGLAGPFRAGRRRRRGRRGDRRRGRSRGRTHVQGRHGAVAQGCRGQRPGAAGTRAPARPDHAGRRRRRPSPPPTPPARRASACRWSRARACAGWPRMWSTARTRRRRRSRARSRPGRWTRASGSRTRPRASAASPGRPTRATLKDILDRRAPRPPRVRQGVPVRHGLEPRRDRRLHGADGHGAGPKAFARAREIAQELQPGFKPPRVSDLYDDQGNLVAMPNMEFMHYLKMGVDDLYSSAARGDSSMGRVRWRAPSRPWATASARRSARPTPTMPRRCTATRARAP
jgi:hypothetical protein